MLIKADMHIDKYYVIRRWNFKAPSDDTRLRVLNLYVSSEFLCVREVVDA